MVEASPPRRRVRPGSVWLGFLVFGLVYLAGGLVAPSVSSAIAGLTSLWLAFLVAGIVIVGALGRWVLRARAVSVWLLSLGVMVLAVLALGGLDPFPSDAALEGGVIGGIIFGVIVVSAAAALWLLGARGPSIGFASAYALATALSGGACTGFRSFGNGSIEDPALGAAAAGAGLYLLVLVVWGLALVLSAATRARRQRP